MNRLSLKRAIVVVLLAGFATVGQPFAQPLQKTKRVPGITLISHVVFIIQENRTFDNYFGSFPGADGATSGPISTGQVIRSRHRPTF